MLEAPFCISAPFILNSKLLPAIVEVAVIVTTSPVQKVVSPPIVLRLTVG